MRSLIFLAALVACGSPATATLAGEGAIQVVDVRAKHVDRDHVLVGIWDYTQPGCGANAGALPSPRHAILVKAEATVGVRALQFVTWARGVGDVAVEIWAADTGRVTIDAVASDRVVGSFDVTLTPQFLLPDGGTPVGESPLSGRFDAPIIDCP